MTKPVDVVNRLCPGAKPSYVAAIARGGPQFSDYSIITPLRLAHFLAQIFHESGGLRIEWESGAYSAKRLLEIFGVGHHSAAITSDEAARLAYNGPAIFERVYGLGNPEKARELGNTQAGDGYKFRGGGLMQTTGKDNYRRIGEKIGVDLVAHPELVLDPRYALLPALVEWGEGRLNYYADGDDLLSVSRAINLGSPHSTKTPNGLADRANWLRQTKAAVGVSVDLSPLAEAPAPAQKPAASPPVGPPTTAPPVPVPPQAPPPQPAAAGLAGVVAAIGRFLAALFKKGQRP